jgi:hypothetical protein
MAQTGSLSGLANIRNFTWAGFSEGIKTKFYLVDRKSLRKEID